MAGMRIRLLALPLLTVVISCGSSLQHPSDSTDGGGEDAPTSGDVGSDAGNATDTLVDSGPTPICDSTGVIVEGTLRGADGTVVETSIAATPMKVTSVDSCSAVSCASPATPAATRIVLTSVADQQSWTLLLRLPSLPADLVQQGDSVVLALTAAVDTFFSKTIDQTIVLSRGGNLVLFVASLSNFGEPRLPDLSPSGIQLEDAGVTCEGPVVSSCGLQRHTVRVTDNGSEALVMPGHTAAVGGLSFSSSAYDRMVDTGACDTKSSVADGRVRGARPGCAILRTFPISGGETVSTGVSKVRVACRGARGLVKTGKKRTANDNAFALAA